MTRTARISARFLHWPNRDDWLTWAHRHGIGPFTPIPNVITCDDEARTITLDVFHQLTELPEAHLRGQCPHFDADRGHERDDPCINEHTIQLEAPALPFPLPAAPLG